MDMEVMLRGLSDYDLEQLRRLCREEQKVREERQRTMETIQSLVTEAKECFGIDMISKETGEVLDEVPFYFY